MSRVLGRGNGYELRMIHNVRPAVELSAPPRWPARTMIFGILIVSASWSDAELFEALRVLLEESQLEDVRDQLVLVPPP